jgi:hypothetical protein
MQQSMLQDKSSKAIQTLSNKVKIDFLILDKQLLLRSTFYYLFCKCNKEARPLKRNKLFAYINSLCKHV